MSKIILHQSQVDAFTVCPLRYKFMADGVQQSVTQKMERGSAIHRTLAWAFKKKIKDLSISKNSMIQYYSKVFTGDADIWKGGLRMLSHFYNQMFERFIPLFPEKDFSVELEHYDIIIEGTWDLITTDYSLCEWKTSSGKWTRQDFEDEIQVPTYAFCFYSVFKRLPKRIIGVVMRNAGVQEFVLRAKKEEIKKSLTKFVNVAESIRKGSYPARPSYECKFCSYAYTCPEKYRER